MSSTEHRPKKPARARAGEDSPSYSQLPAKPRLRRTKRSVTYPGEVDLDIRRRLDELGLPFQDWIESLMAYDIMVGGEHRLTGEYLKRFGSVKGRWELWREAVEMRRLRIPHASIFDVLFSRWEARKKAESVQLASNAKTEVS